MIHDEHPFQTPSDERDPIRQFRGRLVAPVTVLTAGEEGSEAALTVSSLMVAEGDPSSVVALVGAGTDLWDAVESTGRFVVHILSASDREDADAFAGIRPRPGGPFAGVAVGRSEWGPVLESVPNRLYCRLASTSELPFHQLLTAAVERVEIADLRHPAVYFRGEYRKLEDK